MPYIDCYLVPVPRSNRAAYEELARISEPVLKECGAIRITECWLDEFGPDSATYHAAEARRGSEQYSSFRAAAGANQDETVAMSFVEWENKDARDRGMARFTVDPRTQFSDRPQVFEGARLIAAGFTPMLGPRHGA